MTATPYALPFCDSPPLPFSNLDEPTMTVEPLPLVAVPRTHQCFEGEKKARVTSRALCPLSVGVDCLVAHAHTLPRVPTRDPAPISIVYIDVAVLSSYIEHNNQHNQHT